MSISDDLVSRLRNWTTDWNGAKMLPGESPRDGLHCDIIDEAAARIEALEAAIKRQAGAAKTLRKITLDEVQHLKDMDRSEYNAAKTLESEREANAILTAQAEALEARVKELEDCLKECRSR